MYVQDKMLGKKRVAGAWIPAIPTLFSIREQNSFFKISSAQTQKLLNQYDH
jgi:hypothetical protein